MDYYTALFRVFAYLFLRAIAGTRRQGLGLVELLLHLPHTVFAEIDRLHHLTRIWQ